MNARWRRTIKCFLAVGSRIRNPRYLAETEPCFGEDARQFANDVLVHNALLRERWASVGNETRQQATCASDSVSSRKNAHHPHRCPLCGDSAVWWCETMK